MWIWLEQSVVGLWVGESLWAYPILLCLHAIGLAVVVGVFAMRDLRLLGISRGVQPHAFSQIGKLGWAGVVVNGISGTFLFTSQADTFVHSTPFLVKVTCIALGMLIAGIIQARLRDPLADRGDATVISGSTRLLALASLSLWIGAIIAGRLIAYL